MRNTLFIGGPMNGKFSPTRNYDGHVVVKSDNIKDPRTGRALQWTYYRKHIRTKLVKRRDGRKVNRHVDVFVHEGHALDQASAMWMLLRAVPRVLPDQIKLSYSRKMNGVTVYLRVKQKSEQVIVLDSELRTSVVKTDLLTRLTRMGTSPAAGTVEVPVNEESLALFQELRTA